MKLFIILLGLCIFLNSKIVYSYSKILDLSKRKEYRQVKEGYNSPFVIDKGGKGSNKGQQGEIEAILKSRAVVGSSLDALGQYSILIGELGLKEGDIVDDLIPNQAFKLIVRKITDKEVKFSWIEDLEKVKFGYSFSIPYDFKTSVVYNLPIGGAEVKDESSSSSGDKAKVNFEKMDPLIHSRFKEKIRREKVEAINKINVRKKKLKKRVFTPKKTKLPRKLTTPL